MVELVLKKERYIYCYFTAPKKQKEVQFYFSFANFKFDFNIMNYIGDLPMLYIASETVRKIYHD